MRTIRLSTFIRSTAVILALALPQALGACAQPQIASDPSFPPLAASAYSGFR